MSPNQLLSEVNSRRMFLLDDEVFHGLLYSTRIRHPGLVVGSYFIFVRPKGTGKFVAPKKGREVIQMMLQGDPAIEAYWTQHPESVQRYNYTPGQVQQALQAMSDKQLKQFADRLYVACERIEAKLIEMADRLGWDIGNNAPRPKEEANLISALDEKVWHEALIQFKQKPEDVGDDENA